MAAPKLAAAWVLLTITFLTAASGIPSPRNRWVVQCAPAKCAGVRQSLIQRGFVIQGAGKGWFAVSQDPKNAKWRKETAVSVASSFVMNGVLTVEVDPVLMSIGVPKNDLKDLTTYGYCLKDDMPTGKGDEQIPYGIQMVQANSAKLAKEVPDLTGKHMIVCVIDSGLDAHQQDLAKGLNMDGCKFEDPNAPGGCPFQWSGDIVGHGTHVTGTIGAPANGVGVVGVIPKGAETYTVRVFNQTGDVSQGEGLVYGSSLLTAYTQCEGYLDYKQAAEDARYRMVVSMSLGAPGPLSMEKLYFSVAGKRPDLLFVAAAGNNGTQDVQWDSYPGSYAEVMSIGAVDCAGNVAAFSQKNAKVDVAAPGVDVLSTLPSGMGFRQGKLSTGSESKVAAVTTGARYSGLGKVRAQVVDCSTGLGPCHVKGKLCMIQASNNTMLPSSCDMVMYCASQGALGVLLVPPRGWQGDRAYTADLYKPAHSPCSQTMSAVPRQVPPVVGLSLNQAAELRNKLRREASAAVTIDVSSWDYAAWSGTSMATPHASGVAARIWANFPKCTAQEVRRALEQTAKQGPGFKQGTRNAQYGYGIIQAEVAYNYLARTCGKRK